MAFQCVPFIAELTGDTKQDAKAIYRRPSGDLTAGLPMRRHNQWTAKGLEYVTVADAESFALAAPFLRMRGVNPAEFICGIDGDGRPTPWKSELYLAGRQEQQADADAALRVLIAKYGVEMVEQIRGSKVPEHLTHAATSVSEPVEVAAEPEKPRKATIRAARTVQ